MKDTAWIYQSQNAATVQEVDRSIYVNYNYHPHLHPRLELIYAISGSIDVCIDGSDMQVNACEYCIVLPWQIHSFTTPKYSKIMVLVIPHRIVSVFLEQMKSLHGETQVFRVEEEIDQLFHRYIVESAECDEYILTSIVFGICHCFLSSCKLVSNDNRERIGDVQRVLQYISKNRREKLDLKNIAAEMGYDYYYLSRLFNKEVKMGFYEFCSAIRIEDAMLSLMSGDSSITQIAYDCGFSSIRTFNRAFKRVTGMSPSEYRIFAQNNPFSIYQNKYQTTVERSKRNTTEDDGKNEKKKQ